MDDQTMVTRAMDTAKSFDFPVCTCHNSPGGVTVTLRLVTVEEWNVGTPTADIKGYDVERNLVHIAVHKDTPEWRTFVGIHNGR